MQCCAASDGQDFEEIPEQSLEDVATLDIFFHGVDYAKWDPEVHDTRMTPEGKRNLTRIAKALQSSAGTRVKIKGFCGPPIGPKMVALATMRTRVVQDFLKERGCKNEFLVNPLGFEINDKKGPRCEVEICQPEQEKAAPPPAAVVVPAEEKKIPPYLSISFSRGAESGLITKTWYDRPLGFTYGQDVSPVRLTKVVLGSRAHIFEVTEGMEIHDIEFTGQSKVACANAKYEEVHKLLVEGTKVLPHESDRPWLELCFHDPAKPDEINSKTWYSKPLGLTWTPGKSPVQINDVVEGSRAWELGVRVGMQIRSIEFMGQACSDVTSKTYSQTWELLMQGMKILPEAS